ncbi:hypothetical protein K458DRAFT_171793 [Lentithecium fluviatile CBS 122367]|uniref:Uncharacterized protein n=1 Tax=Lentithecium fluviatile CBS 122367 TaxID=1168545 RepID=A0A6G1JCK8_9PLEO|nr:hypothetical protein K458DRAFT_171793 [Lentithecium fluviatile CBS 122367]
MSPPSRYSQSTDETMQKYMLLSSQKEAVRRRLSLQLPTAPPMTASSPEFRSLSSSPTDFRPPAWTPNYGPTYPSPTEPIAAQPSTAHRHSIADTEDAHKLCELNQEIKATLTELLNTESVRSDEKYRAWIQGRLMAAEHQIRDQRRRRSSGSEHDREFASSIAEHLDLGIHTSKTWS